jgi:hypothetical protein
MATPMASRRPASREEFEDKLSGSGLIPHGPKSTKVFGATLDEGTLL